MIVGASFRVGEEEDLMNNLSAVQFQCITACWLVCCSVSVYYCMLACLLFSFSVLLHAGLSAVQFQCITACWLVCCSVSVYYCMLALSMQMNEAKVDGVC